MKNPQEINLLIKEMNHGSYSVTASQPSPNSPTSKNLHDIVDQRKKSATAGQGGEDVRMRAEEESGEGGPGSVG